MSGNKQIGKQPTKEAKKEKPTTKAKLTRRLQPPYSIPKPRTETRRNDEHKYKHREQKSGDASYDVEIEIERDWGWRVVECLAICDR